MYTIVVCFREHILKTSWEGKNVILTIHYPELEVYILLQICLLSADSPRPLIFLIVHTCVMQTPNHIYSY